MTTPPPGQAHNHYPLLFLYFLSAPEEDPCDCESIVKFQTKVEGLLQALTRKHILSQPPPQGRGRAGGGARGERRGSHALWCVGVSLLLACLLLKMGWILDRSARISFGTDPVKSEAPRG